MTLERAIQVLQTRQRWRESERKDRLQCWPGSQHELNSIEESRAVDALLTAIAALEAQVVVVNQFMSGEIGRNTLARRLREGQSDAPHPDTGDTAALDGLLDVFADALIDAPDNYNHARTAIHTHVAALVQAEREACEQKLARSEEITRAVAKQLSKYIAAAVLAEERLKVEREECAMIAEDRALVEWHPAMLTIAKHIRDRSHV